MTNELTVAEREDRFKELDGIVQAGKVVFYAVYTALSEIKEKSLFKEHGYDDFASYVESRGYTKRYLNQMMASANALKELPDDVRALVSNERTAREIAKLPPSLRVAVVIEATKRGKPATAASIKKAAPASSPPPRKSGAKPAASAKPPARKAPPAKTGPKPKGELDATGCEIPSEIMALWMKAQEESQAVLTYISAIKFKINNMALAGSVAFKGVVDFDDTTAHMNQAYMNVELAYPYAVCATCGGKTAKDCLACKGRGYVSKWFWDTCVPEEAKKLREQTK